MVVSDQCLTKTALGFVTELSCLGHRPGQPLPSTVQVTEPGETHTFRYLRTDKAPCGEDVAGYVYQEEGGSRLLTLIND